MVPTFTEWLLNQTHREDEIGDLANDLAPLLDDVDVCATLTGEVDAIAQLLATHAPDIALEVIRGPLRLAHGEYAMTTAAAAGRAASAVVRKELAEHRRWTPSVP